MRQEKRACTYRDVWVSSVTLGIGGWENGVDKNKGGSQHLHNHDGYHRLGSEPQFQLVASLRICWLPMKHFAPFPPFFCSWWGLGIIYMRTKNENLSGCGSLIICCIEWSFLILIHSRKGMIGPTDNGTL